jgi:hypothetical protein
MNQIYVGYISCYHLIRTKPKCNLTVILFIRHIQSYFPFFAVEGDVTVSIYRQIQDRFLAEKELCLRVLGATRLASHKEPSVLFPFL